MSAPAVAVSQDGKHFATAWKDVRDGSGRVWWSSSDEPKFAGEHGVVEGARVDEDHPSLAFDDPGPARAAWENGRGPLATPDRASRRRPCDLPPAPGTRGRRERGRRLGSQDEATRLRRPTPRRTRPLRAPRSRPLGALRRPGRPPRGAWPRPRRR